jgi:hypothetical protein
VANGAYEQMAQNLSQPIFGQNKHNYFHWKKCPESAFAIVEFFSEWLCIFSVTLAFQE